MKDHELNAVWTALGGRGDVLEGEDTQEELEGSQRASVSNLILWAEVLRGRSTPQKEWPKDRIKHTITVEGTTYDLWWDDKGMSYRPR